ncbi:hypothetical protein Bbelb_052050 [Branchiostoma belcheri]|nr:hypothetical protein Bbelb_052050 [Branchiostoma belcheri]
MLVQQESEQEGDTPVTRKRRKRRKVTWESSFLSEATELMSDNTDQQTRKRPAGGGPAPSRPCTASSTSWATTVADTASHSVGSASRTAGPASRTPDPRPSLNDHDPTTTHILPMNNKCQDTNTIKQNIDTLKQMQEVAEKTAKELEDDNNNLEPHHTCNTLHLEKLQTLTSAASAAETRLERSLDGQGSPHLLLSEGKFFPGEEGQTAAAEEGEEERDKEETTSGRDVANHRTRPGTWSASDPQASNSAMGSSRRSASPSSRRPETSSSLLKRKRTNAHNARALNKKKAVGTYPSKPLQYALTQKASERPGHHHQATTNLAATTWPPPPGHHQPGRHHLATNTWPPSPGHHHLAATTWPPTPGLGAGSPRQPQDLPATGALGHLPSPSGRKLLPPTGSWKSLSPANVQPLYVGPALSTCPLLGAMWTLKPPSLSAALHDPGRPCTRVGAGEVQQEEPPSVLIWGDIGRHGTSTDYLDATADCKKLSRKPQQNISQDNRTQGVMEKSQQELQRVRLNGNVSGWDADMFILMKTSGITRPMFQDSLQVMDEIQLVLITLNLDGTDTKLGHMVLVLYKSTKRIGVEIWNTARHGTE